MTKKNIISLQICPHKLCIGFYLLAQKKSEIHWIDLMRSTIINTISRTKADFINDIDYYRVKIYFFTDYSDSLLFNQKRKQKKIYSPNKCVLVAPLKRVLVAPLKHVLVAPLGFFTL